MGKSAPSVDSTGNKIAENKLTYCNDGFLGKQLPDFDSLLWLQGENEARAALASSCTIKVILIWAKFPKGDWHAIQQFEFLAKKYPAVQFLGISSDSTWETAEEMLAFASGSDHKDVNLYKFKYTFPAAYDPDRQVITAFRKLGGVSTLGAGYAFIVDKADTIVWKEVIDMRVLASSSDPAICMHYWNHLLPDNQFPDQLNRLVHDEELVRNGPRPDDDDDDDDDSEEVVYGEGEGIGGDLDAFADGDGDY
jgi:hypothetical protein